MIKGCAVMSFTVGCDFCKEELINVVTPHSWADLKEAIVFRKYLKDKYGWIQTTWGKGEKMYCPKCIIKYKIKDTKIV